MIEIIQKKAIRIMTFSDFKAHTNPLFMDLKLLKVRDLIKINQLKFVFEFYKGNLPVEFNNIFEFNSNIHNYETNSASKYL